MADDPRSPHSQSMWERMIAGEEYITDDSILRAQAPGQALMHRLNSMSPTDAACQDLLRELLGAFGAGSEIRPPFYCDYGSHTFVGARTFANYGLVCLDVARVTIGDDVQIGPNVQLLTPTHPVDPERRRAKWESAAPITLGDNVWLGGGVIVGPGVTIGENTVVGAGAVVVRDLPSNVVAVGNPARVVREIEGSSVPRRHVTDAG